MPTYDQIANYFNNRRRAIGDNNDTDKLKYLEKKIIYNPEETEDNKLFPFGMDYVIGTDTDRFHCGLTSVKLLQKLEQITENNSIFHFYCTQKIIKYNYPLMVSVFSDLRHKFHQIAGMFASHETKLDINHFFTSLDDLMKQSFGIYFEKVFKFTMIDACQAMANCIKRNTPLAQLLCAIFILSPISVIRKILKLVAFL